MYWSSPETDKLDAAILAIQAEMAPVEKSSDNPFFKSKYADLAAIHAAVQPLLTKHRVTVMQMLSGGDGKTAGLLTRLACDGQWFMAEGFMPIVTDKDGKTDPQKYGSATTYFRRYALCAALNIIVVDEDDDGNYASAPPRREAPPPPSPPTRALNKAEQTVVAGIITAIDLSKTEAEVIKVMRNNRAYLESLPDKGRDVQKHSIMTSIGLATTAAQVAAIMKDHGVFLSTLPDQGEDVRKYGAKIFTELKRAESGQGER